MLCNVADKTLELALNGIENVGNGSLLDGGLVLETLAALDLLHG